LGKILLQGGFSGSYHFDAILPKEKGGTVEGAIFHLLALFDAKMSRCCDIS